MHEKSTTSQENINKLQIEENDKTYKKEIYRWGDSKDK